MSERADNGTQAGSPCDGLLDYVYGELAPDAAQAFDRHLGACARCRADLEAMGRVRRAAKAVLPAVEPGDRLTGALHAQLMSAAAEAAAQRKRGKVLPFVRRVVLHPAFAAAASVVLVGGAVGYQWSRGRLLMPHPEGAQVAPAPATSAAAPVLTAEPAVADEKAIPSPPPAEGIPLAPLAQTAAPAATPAATPQAEAKRSEASSRDRRSFRELESDALLEKDAPKDAPVEKAKKLQGGQSAADDPQLFLELNKQDRMAAKPVAPRETRQAQDKGAALDDQAGYGLGGASGEAGRSYAAPARKPKAPSAPEPRSTAAPAGPGSQGVWNADLERQDPRATAPGGGASSGAPAKAASSSARRAELADRAEEASPAPPAVASPAPAPEVAQARGAAREPAKKEAAPERQDGAALALARRAALAARQGRCEEALKLFGELDREHPAYTLSADEKSAQLRCLGAQRPRAQQAPAADGEQKERAKRAAEGATRK